ncbi:YcaO-like family protein [Tenacibaculum aestuariivivum]|uniref:YcaO-like family protein n=1 Tax=Tenacibaculum aestuariivivum TaxID=2006131 RepID=UPI003AB5EEE6
MKLSSYKKHIIVSNLGTKSYSLFLCELNISCTSKNIKGEQFSFEIGVNGIDTNLDLAKVKCLSEFNERYESLNPENIRNATIISPKSDLKQISISSIFNFKKQGIDNDFFFEDYHQRHLVKVKGLINNKDYLFPLSCILPNFNLHVPSTNFVGDIESSGIVSGLGSNDKRDLNLIGLQEVLERDAIMRAWRDPEYKISKIDQSYLPIDLSNHLQELGLTVTIYDVGLSNLSMVILVIVSDSLQRITFGSKATMEITEGIRHSIHEALMIRYKLIRIGLHKLKIQEIVKSSLDHVIYGFQNGGFILSLFEKKKSKNKQTLYAKNALELYYNCQERFLLEPLFYSISSKKNSRVIRVLLINCMRKEWDANNPFLIPLQPTNTSYNNAPHPYG